MLEKLGNALKNTFNKIASAIFVDKEIPVIIRDLQRALIEADVNVKLVKELSEKIKKESENKIKGIDKKEHITKLIHDEILEILGGKKYELELKKKQNIIMFVGLYGSGKTTSIAKLSSYYQKRGKKVAMLGLDVHRPAAPEQLEQLAKANKLKVFPDKKEKNALKIWKNYEEELKKFDVVIVDTAGRHNLDKELEKELRHLAKKISPDKTILVMPADIGQAAKKQAQEFKEACNMNGVIITRMDSSAKGGGVLSACKEVESPVYFIGTGEKIPDLETFNPSAFISRILGLGDLEGLIEKVKSITDKKKQKKIEKRLKEGKLTLLDVKDQVKSMSGLNLSKLSELIPGFGKLKSKVPEGALGAQEEKVKKWQHIIDSMTKEEIENPEILEKQTSRLRRIAKGSGTTTTEIRQLLKQFKILKDFSTGKMGKIEDMDLSSGLSQKQLQKLAKKFGKKIRI